MRLILIPCVCLTSCATIESRLPGVSDASLQQEQIRQEKTAFEDITAFRDRLHRVAHPILKANADICRNTRSDIGVVTHSLDSYSKEMRDGAARELGATDEPRILYVRPESPAEAAGLKVGDILKGSSGKPLKLPSQAARDVWDEDGDITRVRGEESESVSLRPEKLCGYDLKLKMTPTINAYATGRSIIVTSGMINFTETDEELALIIGHELAHNDLGHIRKIVTNMVLSGFATRYTRPFEAEADYVGMYYMARAGYDLENVENIWRRLGRVSPRGIAREKTHPKYPSRFLQIVATAKEIRAKQATGEPLIPNSRTPNRKDRS